MSRLMVLSRGPESGVVGCVARARRRGMTLVEVMMAVVVLTISVYLMSSTITTTLVHTHVKREQALAAEAARNQLEVLRGADFEDVFALYNHAPEDDPDGEGTAPGPYFAVPELALADGDADGFAGEIVLPAQGAALVEKTLLAELGMPRDLDGDFLVDVADHSQDYIILPVLVRVQWKGRAGPRSLQMHTMLAKLRKD